MIYCAKTRQAETTLLTFSMGRKNRLTGSEHGATETLELAGHLSHADKDRSAYLLLPFDVPEGVARLDVGYSFSDDKPGGFLQQPGNVLDIGIFDPRGSKFLSAKGFRGWSGSARREFSIGAGEAMPGYLPGPILPGRWEIILGLVHILPQGCDYRITIRLVGGAAPRHGAVLICAGVLSNLYGGVGCAQTPSTGCSIYKRNARSFNCGSFSIKSRASWTIPAHTPASCIRCIISCAS